MQLYTRRHLSTLLLFALLTLPQFTWSQLRVTPDGNVAINAESTEQAQLQVNNQLREYGLRLNHGKANTTQPLIGVYNYMRLGYGDRIGQYNLVNAQNGPATGLVNKVYNRSSQPITGVQNKLDEPSSGFKTAVYNVLRDDNDSAPNVQEPMIGSRTTISHHNRPAVYGNKIEISRNTVSTDKVAYGVHVNMSSPSASDYLSYGIYSSAPDAGSYAGFFAGNVTVTGDFIDLSDARLKAEAAPIAGPLAIVRKLQPRSYKFRAGTHLGYDRAGGQRLHYGFMAQDLERVLPSLVHEVVQPAVLEPEEVVKKRGKLTDLDPTDAASESIEEVLASADVPEGYAVVQEERTLKGVRYADLIAILTGAVQEQQELIDEMKASIVALQDEVAALKKCTGCSTFGSLNSNLPGSKTAEARGFSTDQLSIYPNPAGSFVVIDYSAAESYTVRVHTSGGQEHFTTSSTGGGVLQVATSDWPAGSYIFEIITNGVVQDHRTVIIAR